MPSGEAGRFMCDVVGNALELGHGWMEVSFEFTTYRELVSKTSLRFPAEPSFPRPSVTPSVYRRCRRGRVGWSITIGSTIYHLTFTIHYPKAHPIHV